MSTIFISHSTQDKTIALQVLERLRKQGYEALFLDSDPEAGIKAGSDWERDLYRNLKLAAAVVVLCSPDSMASRWCFAEITQAKALGKALFPVVIRPCEVVGSLTDRQVIDMAGRGEEESFQRLFDGLRAAGLDPADSFGWDQRRPPFPGFLYFDQEDAGIYFGREGEIRQVVEKLTQMQRQGEPRLFVLVGSSGSGKSSLVRAGVLPRLHKDQSRWAVVEPFRPKTDPVGELARSLSLAFPEGPARPDWKAVRDRLGTEARAAKPGDVGNENPANTVLSEYSDDLTMALGHREASVLVVVDQAEELLQGAAPQESAEFLTLLRNATSRPGGRVFGLLTLRSDFLGSFQNHPALRGVVFADMPLGLLPVEDFPQVIEGPAARAEIALEPGLVPSLIADARTDDALPLLAFTLREMYERCRDQARFTLKVYRDDLGGIKGAVARVVEQIKAEGKWTPETSHALRRAFLKLARVNDQGQFTRQPARWADLPDQAAPVLEQFVKARLLTSNGDTVEVTHESLFRVWSDLAGWLAEGRELMLWKRTIKDEVNEWMTRDRSPLYLLSGGRAAEAQRWLASHADEFQGSEANFLEASVAEERKKQLRLKVFAGGVSVLLAIAILLGIYANSERLQAIAQTKEAERQTKEAEKQTKQANKNEDVAKDQARIANSRQLAAVSASERNNRLDRSLLLAVEAMQTNTFEARDSLFKALHDQPALRTFLHIEEGGVQSVAFSPDGKTIAAGYGGVGGGGGGVVLWDVAARKRLADDPLPVKEGMVWGVSFSPDGKTIAAGYGGFGGGGGVVLWDVAARKRLADHPLPVKEGYVYCVSFSPDGKTIAAGYAGVGVGGGVVVWDVAARKRLADDPLPVKEGYVRGVSFSPDGKTIAAGYGVVVGVGGVVLWDVAARKRLADDPLPVKEGYVTGVAFSADGKTIAAGYGVVVDILGGGGVVVWDVAARKRLADDPLPVKEGYVTGVAFSPDGKTIAAGYSGDVRGGCGVVLWDVAARKRLADDPLPVKEGRVKSVSFSPDGKTIAAGYGEFGGDGVSGVVVWDVAARQRLVGDPFHVKEGGVSGVALSPDGKTIAAGYGKFGGGGGVVVWDVNLKSWQRIAGQIANRNFTRAEWRQFFPDEPYRATFPDLPVPPEVSPNHASSPAAPSK